MKDSQRKKNRNYLTLIPLILFLFLILIFSLNIMTARQIKAYSLLSFPSSFSVKEYPVLDKSLFPDVSAKGAMIVDRKSKVILYQKNPDIRFAPASTTKIMTALVALESFKPEDILTVLKDSEDVGPVKYRKGER